MINRTINLPILIYFIILFLVNSSCKKQKENNNQFIEVPNNIEVKKNLKGNKLFIH